MRTIQRLKSSVWASGGNDTIPLAALPNGARDGLIPYITKIEAVAAIAGTVGATAVTPILWANFLASMTVNVPGGPWGPVNLTGENLQVHNYYQSGSPLPYASDASGDLNAAAAAGAVTRKVRHVYSYEDLGSEDDPFEFCPPASAFKEGNIQITFGATPTNFTVPVVSYAFVVHLVWRGEANSVSRVRTLVKPLIGPNEVIAEAGMPLRIILHNKTADAVVGDFTGFRLWADGTQFVEMNNPLDIRNRYYDEVAKVGTAGPTTSSLFIQETFCDPIGGNFVRGINIYPPNPRAALGDLPTTRQLRYDFDGAPTLANWEIIYTYAYKQDEQHAVALLTGGCGCDAGGFAAGVDAKGGRIPPSLVVVPRGKGGSVLTSTRLSGFTRQTAVPRGSMLANIGAAFGHK